METLPAENHSQPDGNAPQRTGRRFFSWLQSRWIGYLVSVFFITGLVIIEKIDEQFPHAPIFEGTPFAMLSLLIALFWGIWPALFATVLGLVVLAEFFSPGILTPDILKDTVLDGPFLIMQFIALAIIVRLEHYYHKIFATHQQLATAHQELVHTYQELALSNEQLATTHQELVHTYQELTQSNEQLATTHQELVHTYQELTQSNEQLEHANYLKDYIIIRASHEIRTPLTTILGRTQLMSSRMNRFGQTPENWAALQQYLNVVEVRALHLRTLTDSLFEFSRVHKGAFFFQMRPCNVAKLCCDMVTEQRELSGRSIELNLPLDPIMVEGQEELLSQVLVNLLSNAIKYSPENTIIHVGMQTEGGQVTLQIQNECPTISAEQLQRLFDLFYRTPQVEYSPIPGWGLGLSISKEIVRLHGGRIWAKISEGKDITFFVTLPLAEDVAESE